MNSIKHLALGILAASSVGVAFSPALAQAPVTTETQAAAPPPTGTFSTPTMASCLNLPMDDLVRTPACGLLLQRQQMTPADEEQMVICFHKSADDRNADDQCKALWGKFAGIVSLRKAG